MIGILGSGFGLYGYLPAICQHYPNSKVLLVKSAKDKAYLRPELTKYLHRITWIETIKEIIENVNLLVVSYPPYEVQKLTKLIVNSKTIKSVIIEKPVCESPKKSLDFVNQIEKSGKKIISSFLFVYAEWINVMKSDDNNKSIEWKIVNTNSKDSWKWNPNLGGGVLRFYGIHIIAICALFNCKLKELKFNKLNDFEAVFANSYFTVEAHITYIENESMFILNDNLIYSSPFGISEEKILEDYRVPFLVKLFEDLEGNYIFLNKLLKDTISLWSEIESNSIREFEQ